MSNETPKPSHEKTKSAPKRGIKLSLLGGAVPMLIVAAIILAVGLSAMHLKRGGPSATDFSTMTVNPNTEKTKQYKLETVSSTEDQTQGLSGRDGLDQDEGMLFTYPGEREERCIWMKDMKFKIDVLWLDREKRIISAISNLAPETYPQKYCANAAYIVELPAGAIRESGMRIGQTVQL